MRLAVTLCLAVLAAGTARAHDDDRALAPFARPWPAATRGQAVDALEWERRLRPPDRFGPAPLRAADTALFAAARQGLWPEVLRLVKTGQAHANPRDAQAGHVLVMAARAGQDELVRELVRRGAELDRVGDDGHTALGAAAFAGRRSTVRLLLLAGADPARFGSSGQTALHLASFAGQTDVLNEMLRLGVDVELLNRQRESALDVAAGVGQLDAMARLIESGADSTRAGRR